MYKKDVLYMFELDQKLPNDKYLIYKGYVIDEDNYTITVSTIKDEQPIIIGKSTLRRGIPQ